jgi:CHAT domain-containing protein
MHRVPRIVAAALAVVLAAAPTAAQEDSEQLRAAQKFLTANQFAPALEEFLKIPDSAPAAERLGRHTGAALSLVNMGRANEAAVHLDRARPLVDEAGTPVARVRFLHAEGFYLDAIGRGGGLQTLLQAVEIAERAGAIRSLPRLYSAVATSYQRLEDYERATYFNQKEFELIEQPTAINRFEYHLSRGIAFFEMYERDAAEREFLRCLELTGETGRIRDRGFVKGKLAFLYWTFDRDAARALPLYEEAIELMRQAKASASEANWLTNRGNIHRDTGRYALAEADYRAAIAILERGGLQNQGFHIHKNIAQVWRLQGRTREAAAALERLLKDQRGIAAMRHLWQAHMELASAYATLGERDRAEAEFMAMLDVLEEHRSTAILDAFRTGAPAHQPSASDPYERYIRFLANATPPRAHDALAIAERARARGFLDALAPVRSAVASTLPRVLLTEESRIRRAISAAQEQLRVADLPKAERARLIADLERAEQDRETFLLTLRVEHPSLAEARYPTLLDVQAVQSELRADEIAVVYFLAEPNSFRWVLSHEHLVFDQIAGRAAIETEVARMRELLRAPGSGNELTTVSARLGAMLFERIATAEERPLVVVPHGALHYIPFEALRWQGKLLIERHAVSYAPSLNALVQLRKMPSSREPFRVLAVGNPAIARRGPAAGERGTTASDLENLSLLGPLPFAEQELHAIGRTFPNRTRIISGTSARESALRDAGVPRYPVLHFATHGLVSDVHPKRSGLLLAAENGEDGLLQMGEIYNLGLNANLVVLSACQTALGREITGEGLIGLSRAFFYAGTRAVVTTLSNRNDRFAAEFVARFYRELNAGRSSEEALRQAKLAYAAHPQYSHPFYWASLVLLGDGSTAVVGEPVRQPMGAFWLATLFILSAVAVTLANLRRNV